MRVPARTIAAVTVALLGMCVTAVSIHAAQGSVRGAVADGSGGRLPGVTVVAAAADGQVLATAVTNPVGAYLLDALPEGAVHLTFELEGFSAAAVDVAIHAGVEARVAPRLTLATRIESVVVYGKSPVVSVSPPRLPPPPPAPAPVLHPVPSHDRDSICGPAKPDAIA